MSGNIVPAALSRELIICDAISQALYFINILVDVRALREKLRRRRTDIAPPQTTIGVFLVYLFLRLLTHVLSVTLGLPLSSLGLISGLYPSPFLTSWSRQLGLYLAALSLMKLSVILLFWIGGDALVKLGDWVIETISGDPKVQVLVSVMIGPVILNVLQFLLIDSFIKGKGDGYPPELMETDDEDEEARHQFLGGNGTGHDGSDDDDDGEGGNGAKSTGGSGGRSSRKSFHDARPSDSKRHTGSAWFSKIVPGATGGGGDGQTNRDSDAHSYPPSIAGSSMRRGSGSGSGGEGREKNRSSPEQAGEGEGWDDDGWDDWNDDDDKPSSTTAVEQMDAGRPSPPLQQQHHRPPSIGKQVHWPPLIGEKEEDDFPMGSPGTPRIVVTEAF